jgi:hypothetical protein
MVLAYSSGFNEPGAISGIWVVTIVRTFVRFKWDLPKLALDWHVP